METVYIVRGYHGEIGDDDYNDWIVGAYDTKPLADAIIVELKRLAGQLHDAVNASRALREEGSLDDYYGDLETWNIEVEQLADSPTYKRFKKVAGYEPAGEDVFNVSFWTHGCRVTRENNNDLDLKIEDKVEAA